MLCSVTVIVQLRLYLLKVYPYLEPGIVPVS